MMIHPDPQKVFNVGSGVGFTLGAKSNFPEVEKLHGVEIDPVILEVAPKYFSEFNNNVFEDKRLEIFVTDARNYLLTTKEKHDVIVSAPYHPAIYGVSRLFTKEFFELTK